MAADLYIVGVDSNVSGDEAVAFQARLRELQFDYAENLARETVTVAKQRTMFQTQVIKSGETDVSCAGFLSAMRSAEAEKRHRIPVEPLSPSR